MGLSITFVLLMVFSLIFIGISVWFMFAPPAALYNALGYSISSSKQRDTSPVAPPASTTVLTWNNNYPAYVLLAIGIVMMIAALIVFFL